jgi:hypothetical protein
MVGWEGIFDPLGVVILHVHPESSMPAAALPWHHIGGYLFSDDFLYRFLFLAASR